MKNLDSWSMKAIPRCGSPAANDRLDSSNKASDNVQVLSHSAIPDHILGVLDPLGCGGVLLDPSGRVLSHNLQALACLGEGLTLAGEHLSAIDRATDRRLQQFVGIALSRYGAHVPMAVTVPRPARLPLVIRTSHLEPPPGLGHPAGLLLLILDPELWPEPSHEMLSQAFGLTRAEADVATGIASGRTLSKIAADRGVKIGTVRTHLKTVLSKTHTRGQADLTRVLTRLAFLVPDTEQNIAPALRRDILPAAENGSHTGGVVVPSERSHENGRKTLSSRRKIVLLK
jgi:DNA-binding CsgD family transcriptional regulator